MSIILKGAKSNDQSLTDNKTWILKKERTVENVNIK